MLRGCPLATSRESPPRNLRGPEVPASQQQGVRVRTAPSRCPRRWHSRSARGWDCGAPIVCGGLMRAQCSLEAPGFQEAPDVTPPGFMKLESRALRSQALDFHLETGPNVSACLPASSQMPPSCQAAVSQGRTQLKRKARGPAAVLGTHRCPEP